MSFNSDYVEVHVRIAKFYEQYPDGRLTTESVALNMDPDGTPRVWVGAAAYRTPDDPVPGRGWSYMAVPGTTNFTRGSELENTETSAWGRALAAVGIEVKKGIASASEVRNKQSSGGGAASSSAAATTEETLVALGTKSFKGKVAKGEGRHSDMAWKETPDGHHMGFRLIVDGGAVPDRKSVV